MNPEIAKLVVTFLGGSVVSAVLTELLRRRRERVQRLSLVERVNRVVQSGIKGIVLARVGDGNSLVPVDRLREYQLTLKNSTGHHLKDADIQFDFSGSDVEAWAERPALSKTPLIPRDANVPEGSSKSFRWTIPQFVSSDSVEFTFRSIDPSSEVYEVALFNAPGIVVERVAADVKQAGSRRDWREGAPLLASILAFLGVALFFSLTEIGKGDKQTPQAATVTRAGCSLTLLSFTEERSPEGAHAPPAWDVTTRVTNAGDHRCQVAIPPGFGETGLAPSQISETTYSLLGVPTLKPRQIFLGAEKPLEGADVSIYGKP